MTCTTDTIDAISCTTDLMHCTTDDLMTCTTETVSCTIIINTVFIYAKNHSEAHYILHEYTDYLKIYNRDVVVK